MLTTQTYRSREIEIRVYELAEGLGFSFDIFVTRHVGDEAIVSKLLPKAGSYTTRSEALEAGFAFGRRQIDVELG